ncbi:MAG TPA: lysophospholipid acyltransferase family protein [Lutibacter sp.]
MIVFGPVLAVARLLLFMLIVLIFFCLLLAVSLFYKCTEKKLERGILLRRFAIRVLHPILGSKIIVYGKETAESGLIVSNHRSYFDAMIVLKNMLASPVGKKEVESWPLIGKVCKNTGVIFVNRENKLSRKKTLGDVRMVLENGFSIYIAPEGTTHIEPATIAFKPGGFFLAAELGIPVIPIAIDYKNMDDAWIGDATFIPHFLKCFSKWRTEIKVSYLNPIVSDNAEDLMSIAKKQIDQELVRFRKDWNLID